MTDRPIPMPRQAWKQFLDLERTAQALSQRAAIARDTVANHIASCAQMAEVPDGYKFDRKRGEFFKPRAEAGTESEQEIGERKERNDPEVPAGPGGAGDGRAGDSCSQP